MKYIIQSAILVFMVLCEINLTWSMQDGNKKPAIALTKDTLQVRELLEDFDLHQDSNPDQALLFAQKATES